jgi:hypothetical protein
MLTAALLHTAAPLDSRTNCRAHYQTVVHRCAHCCTAGQYRALCRTLPPHTALIRMQDTAHSRTPQWTWIETIYYMNVYAFKWIKTILCECIWICININVILFQTVWCIPNLYKFAQICVEFVWKCAHCCTAAHCRTARQPHRLPRALPDSRTLPRALLYRRPKPCALSHTAAHCMNSNAGQPHTAHRLLHIVHSRTLQLTWIKIIQCERVCIYMNWCKFKFVG